jgi:hypothetical protein
MAVNNKSTVFWDVTPYSVVNTSNVLEELAASIFWEEEEDRGSRFL